MSTTFHNVPSCASTVPSLDSLIVKFEHGKSSDCFPSLYTVGGYAVLHCDYKLTCMSFFVYFRCNEFGFF